MSTLQFPSNPVNGELYPPNPPQGDVQYQYDAAAGTWRILGAATGVIPGTYGSIDNIPQFTVDASGKLTFAQNLPITGLVGTLQTVTDNGNTTTNPMQVNLTSSGATGFTVVNSNAITDRVEIHPTFVAVRNGYLEIQENSLPSITVDALGVPYIRIRRDGYLSLGTGSTVFTEKIRLQGSDGSASFDGSVAVDSLTATGDIRVFDGPFQVAQIAPASSFFDQLTIAGLNYPTADAPAGYIMTTDGLGNLTLQPTPAVVASTLQGVTDNGNTTTNPIDFTDGVGSTVISIDPTTGQISLPPQSAGEPGTYIDATSILFGGSTVSIITTGANPGSLNFRGNAGIDLTTNAGTVPVALRPGGVSQLTVTGTSTNIANALIASGLSYPTADGTNGQVLSTDGSGNLGWSSVVTTFGDLQNVTNNGNSTTNSIIIDGTVNPTFPLIITATGVERSIQIKGDAGTNKAYIQFANNAGTVPYGVIASGPSFLDFGIGSTAPIVSITTAGTLVSNAATMTAGLDISGNISGIYQLRTSGLGGIVVGSAGVDRANIQGATGNISTVGSLSASGLNYPTFDGSAGQVISTDGNGNLGWGSLSTGNLQIVTDAGSTTTNSITVGGLTSTGSVSMQGGPVSVQSLQIGTLSEISSLNAGFANVSGTANFGNSMAIAHVIDTTLGIQNRIITTDYDLILGTQGGSGASTYYSDLVVINQGDGAAFPNTSFVSLGYGDGIQKLQTTSNGVTVVGLDATGPANFEDNINIGPSTSSIYASGSDTYFTNSVTNTIGSIYIQGANVNLENHDGTVPLATFAEVGDSIMYYEGSERVRLDLDGVTLSERLSVVVSAIEILNVGTNGIGVTGDVDASGTVYGAAFNTAGTLTVLGSSSLAGLTASAFSQFLAGLQVTGNTATTSLTAAGLSYPTVDGAAGQVIVTDGAGNLSWTNNIGTLQQVTTAGATTTNTITVQDGGGTNITTVAPASLDVLSGSQRGTLTPGSLQVYGSTGIRLYNSLISPVQTLSLESLTGKATVNSLVAAGLTYPTTDGTANQVITTNGSGTLGWLTTARVVATPASSASAGSQGQIAFGTGFFYFHDGTQWLRVAGTTF